jgi:hypothetical protein
LVIWKVLKSAIPVVPSVGPDEPDILLASTPADTEQPESLKRERETVTDPTALVYKSVNLSFIVV